MCVLNVVSHQRNFTAIKVIAQPSYPTYSKLKTFHKVHCCLMRYYILTEAIFFKQPRLIQVGKYQNIKTVHFLKISFLQLELVFSGINKVLKFVCSMNNSKIVSPHYGLRGEKEKLSDHHWRKIMTSQGPDARFPRIIVVRSRHET